MARAPDRSSWHEDVVTIGLSAWTILGLFVDAYKHSTDPDLETFWTPWHALFYSGFIASAAWLIWMAWRRREGQATTLESAPRGHRVALYGIAIFAVGGMGDAVWHEIFGVETSLDALLSPTHLIIWIGALAMVSTPFRAAWSDRSHDDAASPREFAPVLASLLFTLTAVAFFHIYLWTPVHDDPRLVFMPDLGIGDVEAARGVAGVLVSTAILMAPVLLAARRWHLPFGSVTILFGGVNALMAFGFDAQPAALPAIVLAGLVADTVINLNLPRYVLAGATPFVLWSGYFILVGRLDPGLAWPPELWGGSIIFGVLVGLVLEAGMNQAALVADPAQRPETSEPISR